MATLQGLLLVNKPSNITSHDVVGRVRRAVQMREVGHTGTLDPLASGLMVLLLGEATKLSDYILNGNKAYRVRVKLGVRTDTLDVTGQILSQQDVKLDPDLIAAEVRKLEGEFEWPVPMFSAVKSGGKKMYEYARKEDAPVEIPKRIMKFWDVKIEDIGSDFALVSLTCSKGSFIRSWASELGERLKVGGAVETLERTLSEPYALERAVTLEAIDKSEWGEAYIPLREALPTWKSLTVRGKDERLIFNGQISYDLERRLIVEQKEATLGQKTVGIKVMSAATGELLSIIEAQPNRGLKIRRVFKMT